MIGYVLMHRITNELIIDCTNDMSCEDFAMSGKIWTDKNLALAALKDHLSCIQYHGEPAYLAEVILPDPAS